MKTSFSYSYPRKGLFYAPHSSDKKYEIDDKNSIVNFPIDSTQDKNNKELSELIYHTKQKEEVTMVVIPSLSLPGDCLKDIKGIAHYEIRSLWHILLAKENNLKVLFLTSIEFPKEAVIHLLDSMGRRDLLESRIDFLHFKGSEKLCLSEIILSSDNSIKILKNKLASSKSFLMSFIASSSEEQIAKILNIPFYGVKEIYQFYQTKSGNRQIFKEAQVSYPEGFENLKNEFDVIDAIEKLKINNPETRRMVVKLDHGVSGKGNALFEMNISHKHFFKLSKEKRYSLIKSCLNKMSFQVEKMTWKLFSKQLVNGAVVELFIEGEIKHSPSCQAVIRPNGKIDILSTHEQLLDKSGMVFLGCKFPAKNNYRLKLHSETMKVGKKLALKGIIGFFSIDFLVVEKNNVFESSIIEINLRQGGTTHPYQTARLITDSTYTSTGHLLNPDGDFVFYSSNDNFISKNLIGREFSNLIVHMEAKNLVFTKERGQGVTFHLSTTLKPYGKIGYIVIANTEEKVLSLRAKIEKELASF